MKRIVTFVLLAAGLLTLCTGCDWIRASLGKPTSQDLAAIRTQLAQREQALRDSLKAVHAAKTQPRAAEADSLPVETAAPAVSVPAVSDPAPRDSRDPLKKYYAVAGAFRDPAGAQSYAEKLKANGLRVRMLPFKSGLTAVCVEGSDSIEDVRRDVEKLRQLQVASSDPWIYSTNQKLHKEI